MLDTILWLLAALLTFAAAAVALFFFARWAFERAAVRGLARLEDAVGVWSRHPAVVQAGRAAREVVTRVGPDRLTRWARYAAAQGISSEEARARFGSQVERLATLMDSAVKVPVIGRVGVDALLGLVPFVGDATSAGVSLVLIGRALQFGLPRELVAKMLANVLTDLLLGAIPIVGDLADIWFRANTRNVKLLREYLDAQPGSPEGRAV